MTRATSADDAKRLGRPDEAKRIGRPEAAKRVGRRLETVLVAEDDPDVRAVMARLARGLGARVIEAASVAEALALLVPPPDLIITDVRFPDGSGEAIVAAAGRLRPTPLVAAVSGAATAEEAFTLAQLGARVFVPKPFSLGELRDAIESALDSDPLLEPLVAAHVGHTPLRELQGDVRRTMVEQAMALTDGSRSGAARLLSVSRQAVQQIVRSLPESDATPPSSPSDPPPPSPSKSTS